MQFLHSAMGYLGEAVLLASAASALLPKDSVISAWLAWFGSMPIRHLPAKKVDSRP